MLANRFDVIQYLRDRDGMMFGLIEAGIQSSHYHVGFISIAAMQALRLDAVATITITSDTDSSDIPVLIRTLGAEMGLCPSDDEIREFMMAMDASDYRRTLKV